MYRQVHHFGFTDLSAGHNRCYHHFLDAIQKIRHWNISEKQLQEYLCLRKTDLDGNNA